ncbi:hypothetical protein Fot_43196 [Forsythia ovata]|uniref:Uncharacterized protein n=1 Tax=Forsythia ovata TaxID=205694 RepID=A0ABD1RNC2_9LAMI
MEYLAIFWYSSECSVLQVVVPYFRFLDCELVRPEVTWGEIIRQRMFDSRVGQIFTEILWEYVMWVGLLALSLRPLPLMHIYRFTTRLIKRPLTQNQHRDPCNLGRKYQARLEDRFKRPHA